MFKTVQLNLLQLLNVYLGVPRSKFKVNKTKFKFSKSTNVWPIALHYAKKFLLFCENFSEYFERLLTKKGGKIIWTAVTKDDLRKLSL